MTFIAFDFETATAARSAPCALGFTLVENGAIKESKYYLINPEVEISPFNTSIHGITDEMVEAAPTFPEIWEDIKELFQSTNLIAHNAQLDISVLKSVLDRYSISIPNNLKYCCTYQCARRKVFDSKSYKLNHLGFAWRLRGRCADNARFFAVPFWALPHNSG